MVDSSLYSVFDDFLRRHPRGVLIGKFLLSWNEIVSQVIDASFVERTKVIGIVNEELIVSCQDTVTKSEIFLHRGKLLDAYRHKFKDLLFSNIHAKYREADFGKQNPSKPFIEDSVENARQTPTNQAPAAVQLESFTSTHKPSRGMNIKEHAGASIKGNIKRENVFSSTFHSNKQDSATGFEKLSNTRTSPIIRGRSTHKTVNQRFQKSQKSPIQKPYSKKTYGKYVSKQELQMFYPDVGITSAFVDGDDFYS